MKIVDIKNVVRKDVPIYYRRVYSGIVVIDLFHKPEEFQLNFQIEHMPTGQTEISILSMDKVDYPLIPLQKELKTFIGTLDSSGKLPN
jgi:hypothetical protein